jgi:hypothetical protein
MPPAPRHQSVCLNMIVKNEAKVIARCLRALLADEEDLEIVVIANGCADDTAAVAGKHAGVRVLELTEASKSAALNAGDAAVSTFPRIYLDADIALPPGSIRALAAALDAAEAGGPLAAMPARTFDLRGRPIPVRAFYAISRRLPVYRTALFGRGVIALSAAGRARFERFPDLTADDLFLDALFTSAEKHQVDSVLATIGTPRRTRDLVRRLARVRAGNATMRTSSASPEEAPSSSASHEATPGSSAPHEAAPGPVTVRSASNTSWLTDVVLRKPWLAPAGVCYAALIVAAELTARRAAGRGGVAWGHDQSSR